MDQGEGWQFEAGRGGRKIELSAREESSLHVCQYMLLCMRVHMPKVMSDDDEVIGDDQVLGSDEVHATSYHHMCMWPRSTPESCNFRTSSAEPRHS